ARGEGALQPDVGGESASPRRSFLDGRRRSPEDEVASASLCGGTRTARLAMGALPQVGLQSPLTPAPSPPRGEGGALAALLIGWLAFASPAFAQDDTAPKPPEAQYAELCGMCHRANGMGTGLLSRRLPPEQAQLEARDNLTAEYVALVVRNGLNNMPPLS